MNKIFNICLLGLAMITLTACGDVADEITSLLLDRNLSPINLTAKNVGETTADIQWTASENATSYNLEVFADDSLTFAGTPIKTFTGIEGTKVSIDGLLFDTKYSVRVQAITQGNESRTSKWNGAFFRTGTKQFLKNPKPADIADRSVTLKWETEEGFDVTTIVIGSITHQITEEEKAAGQATIEGLTPETTYTAYLYYNGKQCGNRTFTTIADLAGAILVHEDDDFKAMLEDEGLADGTVFALYGGTYELNPNDNGQTGAVKISKTITIKGIYPTDQPLIKGRFELYDGAGFSISQCVIDGRDNATTDQIFNFKSEDVAYGALEVENCIITGKSECKGILYLNVPSTVEAININNSIVYGIECTGGDFIDSRKGLPKQVNLIRSTFYTVATERDFIRIDDASDSFGGQDGPKVKVDNCTLYKVGAGGANYRLLYVRFVGNKLTFTNNIVVGTTYKRGFTNQSKSDPEPTLQNNYYFNCENLTSAGASADATIVWFDTEGTIGDPGFKDPDNGDFTLNADAAANRGKAGDPRWFAK
ncbi:MAG: DUF4957 domain-containing protein [Prevotella sp.]|nr:DUF4957 domain-containing protein [Prevotella sp.]